MNFNESLGVKGFCFRGFSDNRVVAQKVKECGLNIIDLSGCQVDGKKLETHDEVIKIYREAEVEISGIGTCLFTGEADDEGFFKFCEKAGCKTITFTGKPDTFFDAVAQAEKWAEKYDVRLAIHNHGGKDWLSSGEMLEYVFGRTDKRVGLCIDTAWAMQSGENPIEWVSRFAGRIYATHFKDFVFDRAGKHRDVVIGEGNLDVAAYVKALKSINFEGPAVIEYEADKDNPVPALRECVEKMRQVLKTVE